MRCIHDSMTVAVCLATNANIFPKFFNARGASTLHCASCAAKSPTTVPCECVLYVSAQEQDDVNEAYCGSRSGFLMGHAWYLKATTIYIIVDQGVLELI
jgi:hypothetical protein